ncbi:MAG: formylmethanofuran dehydrogenase subunit C [Fimbriiglobus sp.]
MLRLTLHTAPTVPLELHGITPCGLVGLSSDDVSRRVVLHGNREEALGEFFNVEGDTESGEMLIRGDCSRIKLIGSAMKAGRIVVEGDVGMHAGAKMTGGELTIHGNAAEWLAAEMSGGTIRVLGNVSDQCGAGYRGSRLGMRGGLIHITGSCGAEAGLLMRRGLIAVEGDVGDYAAANMIAGTIVAFGKLGRAAGDGMKRGTLLAIQPPAQFAEGFRYSCTYQPSYLGLLMRHLRQQNIEAARHYDITTVRCYRGDVLQGGRGELLLAEF